MNIERWSVDKIYPTQDNPRRKIDPKSPKFLELVESIKTRGILQAPVGRPHPDVTRVGIDLRAGARRYAAAVAAGLKEIEVNVIDMDDREAMAVTICENKDREDLTPMEEARGVAHMLNSGWDREAVADKLGKSVGWCVRRAQLMKLDPIWQATADELNISAPHLELIARYDAEVQQDLFDNLRYQIPDFFIEADSLLRLRKYLAEQMKSLSLAPWGLADDKLEPRVGACLKCTKRTSCQPELFEDAEGPAKKKTSKQDRCLDAECFDNKLKLFGERQAQEALAKYPTAVRVATSYGYDGKTKCMAPHDFKQVAEKTKGAKPAVVIHGSDLGEIIWIKPNDQRSATGAEEMSKAESPKEDLAAKRRQLNRRRWALILQQIQKLLKESDDLPVIPYYRTAKGMLSLVVEFGTFDSGEDSWQDLDRLEKAKEVDVVTHAWAMVRPPLAHLLDFYQVGAIDEHHEESARRIMELIGWDMFDRWETACKEIPDPKSWAALEDVNAPAGTPDKKAPAKKPAKGARSSGKKST